MPGAVQICGGGHPGGWESCPAAAHRAQVTCAGNSASPTAARLCTHVCNSLDLMLFFTSSPPACAAHEATFMQCPCRCSNGTCLPPAASGGPSLHAEVQLRLQRQVLPQPSAQRGLYIFSTHVCMAICVSPFAALRHAQKGASRMPASERPALHVCKVG